MKFNFYIIHLTTLLSTYAKFIDRNGNLIINYENILDLASMANNVYLNPQDSKWLNTTLQEVQDISLNTESLKVYLFRNSQLKINVISIKGTSLYWRYPQNILNNTCSINDKDIYIDSTYYNDKYNDNMYFSCCYYKQSNLFEKCDQCQDEYNTCCLQCYDNTKNLELNYINIGSEIVTNLQKIIDFNEEVLFTGHSLGGTVASLLAIKYNKIGVGFESPGDKHYADMINMDYTNNRIYHFGHNADPIFMGDCGGTCNILGYSIYTKCHIGNTCVYDSKDKLKMGESLWNHRIHYVIDNIISQWQNNMPECSKSNNCNDCEKWTYH